MNLYTITDSLLRLQEMLEDPEIDQQLVEDCITDYTEELEVKADGYARVIKNLEANAEALDKEIKRLQARKKSCENGAKRLKDNLYESMKALNKPKIKNDLFTISIKKNGGKAPIILDVDDVDELPDVLVKVTKTADMTSIAEWIELKGECPYAHIGERGDHLSIQ